MRIPDNQANNVGSAGVNRTPETVTATSANRATPASATEGRSNDEIQLSRLAAHLKAESPGSAERASRIEHLRMQVASGAYRPDAEKISQALIDEAVGSSRDVKQQKH